MSAAQPFEVALARFFSLALQTARLNKMTSMSEFANALESAPEFVEVVQAASAVERTEALCQGISGGDRFMVAAFLRRSGVYSSLYAGELPHMTEIAGQFRALLLQSQVPVTYLAPIEMIQLSRDRLDFGPFAIQRFRRDELIKITQNDTR
jgi:hypothetical protein